MQGVGLDSTSGSSVSIGSWGVPSTDAPTPQGCSSSIDQGISDSSIEDSSADSRDYESSFIASSSASDEDSAE